MARSLCGGPPVVVFGSLTLRKNVDRLLAGGPDGPVWKPQTVPAGCMLEEQAELALGFVWRSTGTSQECESLLRCREAVRWG